MNFTPPRETREWMGLGATEGTIVARWRLAGLLFLVAIAALSLIEAGTSLAATAALGSMAVTTVMIVADARGRRVSRQRLRDAQALHAAIVDLLAADGIDLLDADDRDGLSDQIVRTLERLSRQVDADRAWLMVGNDVATTHCWSADGGFRPADAQRLTAVATMRASWQGNRILLRTREQGAFPWLRRRRVDDSAMAGLLLLRSAELEDVALLGFAGVSGLRVWRETPDGVGAALSVILQLLRRNRLNEDRLTLERKLAIGRRMETMGALASGVAHNLNNIIGAIAGFGETAELYVSPGTPAANSLAEIRLAVDRARTLVGDVLKFGRRAEGPPERVEISALIAETLKLLEASLATNVALDIAEVPEQLLTAGESGQLQQVLLNIFNNAALAMPAGGTIRCVCGRRVLDDPLSLSHAVLRRGAYVRIAIGDEGCGIAPAALEQLFDPFFTTRSGGTGLGLSTAREIVEAHGGTIDVTSELGRGSCFALWLPLADVAHDEESADYRRGAGETVLLLNRDAARLANDEELVAALGYEPRGAITDAIGRPDSEIDVVLIAGFDVRATAEDAARLRSTGWAGPMLVAVPQPLLVPDLPALRYPLRPADLAARLFRIFDRAEPDAAASARPSTDAVAVPVDVTRNTSRAL